MSYIRKNVTKGATPGSGAASPKDPNVAVYLAEDIISMPVRDGAGVKMEGDFVLAAGKTPIAVYMTGVNQDQGFETDGDVDAEQIKQMFTATHPGDSLDAHEFYQNHLGMDLVIVTGDCSTPTKRVFGSQCTPMRMKANFKANNEKTGFEFTFEQIQSSRFVPGKWDGVVAYAAPTATDVTLALLVATGYQYKVEELAVTAAISVTSIDLAHGSKVTLIGSGGAGPATLSTGSLDGAPATINAILKDGTQWVALAGATITLEVFVESAKTYLIERNRTA